MSIRLEARNRGNIRLDMDNASLAAKYAREAGAAEKAAELSAANAAGAAERADAAAEAALRAEAGAQSAAVHLPQPGENGTWLVWDQAGDSYVDSGENCTGVQGERGLKGDTGDKGDKGDTGSKGDDGVSPTVTVTDITGGHRVTITDANHPQGQPFDVMDGEVAQEDFDELSGDVDDLKSAVNGLCHVDSIAVRFVVDGRGYVSYSSGNISGTASAMSHTDYIDVSNYKSLRYKRRGVTSANTPAGMAFYQSDKSTWAGGEQCAVSQEQEGYLSELSDISVPENAKYARFTLYTDTTTYGDFELFGVPAIIDDIDSLKTDLQTLATDMESAIAEQSSAISELTSSVNEIYDMFPSEEIPFEISQSQNYINMNTGKGGIASALPVFATTYVDIQNYDCLIYTKAYGSANNFYGCGAAFYTDTAQSTYIPGSSIPNIVGQEYGYTVAIAKVPAGAKYARFTGLSEVEGFFIKGMPVAEKPWKGLYISLLGDSLSALKGYIPAGNAAYYNRNPDPSNSGITQPSEMWWGKVISALGGTPLIIDAWSGSCVCTSIRDAAARTPMVDYSRCNNLHAYIQTTQSDEGALLVVESNPGDGEVLLSSIRTSPFLPAYTPSVGDYVKRINPDIVIVEGGGNDYSYIENMEQFGTFNGQSDYQDPTGETAKVTTFCDAYATLIGRIHKEYPLALPICCAGIFMCRPFAKKWALIRHSIFTSLEEQQKGESGTKVYIAIQDFMDAIAEIAGLFGCPVIDFFTQGFTRYNYYGENGQGFASDDENQTTHPNKNGMTVIAENVTPKFKEACAGFVKWLRENKDGN